MMIRVNSILLLAKLIVTSCGTFASPQQNVPTQDSQSATLPTPTTVPVQPTSAEAQSAPPSDAPHVEVLDVTRLTLGDNKISSSPKRGYVYSCMSQFNGGGAQGTGPWINNDGTWDLTRKFTGLGMYASGPSTVIYFRCRSHTSIGSLAQP